MNRRKTMLFMLIVVTALFFLSGCSAENKGYGEDDVATLKWYVFAMNHYNSIYQIHMDLNSFSGHLMTAREGIDDYNDLQVLFSAKERLSDIKQNHEELKVFSDGLIIEMKPRNIDVSDTISILNSYEQGIHYYGKAIESLESYSMGGSSNDYNFFIENIERAREKFTSESGKALERYGEFFGRVLNY